MSDKKFNPKNKNKLNDNKRLKLIPPDIIIKYLDLKGSGNIVDYGAGTGFFTFILAEYFPNSRIFALDIDEEMVDTMIANNNTNNVFPLQIEDNQIPFANEDLIAVWSIAVYHELDTPEKWLANSYNALKKGGKILIIDWSPAQSPEIEMGPPLNHRIKPEKVKEDLQKSGFKNIVNIDGLSLHFGFVAEK